MNCLKFPLWNFCCCCIVLCIAASFVCWKSVREWKRKWWENFMKNNFPPTTKLFSWVIWGKMTERKWRSQKLMAQHFAVWWPFYSSCNNVIAARITNYLFQDDEENFDDLFRMKYNLVGALLLIFRLSSTHAHTHAHFPRSLFTQSYLSTLWVQEAVADFDSERRTHLLARKYYVLEKLDSEKSREDKTPAHETIEK